MARRTILVLIPAILTAGCGTSPAGSDQDTIEAPLTAEIMTEMTANIEFVATARMLTSQGQKLSLGHGIVRYPSDGSSAGAFMVMIPVVNRESNESDRYSWLTYERELDAAPVVALNEVEKMEAIYEPACAQFCDDKGDCYVVCAPAGGSCGTHFETDLCKQSGTWTGAYCVDGTKHWRYPRKYLYYYTKGRKVGHKDYVYSCGSSPVPGDSNCSATCN